MVSSGVAEEDDISTPGCGSLCRRAWLAAVVAFCFFFIPCFCLLFVVGGFSASCESIGGVRVENAGVTLDFGVGGGVVAHLITTVIIGLVTAAVLGPNWGTLGPLFLVEARRAEAVTETTP